MRNSAQSLESLADNWIKFFNDDHRLYTVKDKKDGEILLKDKTFQECIKYLGMSEGTFASAVIYSNSPFRISYTSHNVTRFSVLETCRKAPCCEKCTLHNRVCLAPIVLERICKK